MMPVASSWLFTGERHRAEMSSSNPMSSRASRQCSTTYNLTIVLAILTSKHSANSTPIITYSSGQFGRSQRKRAKAQKHLSPSERRLGITVYLIPRLPCDFPTQNFGFFWLRATFLLRQPSPSTYYSWNTGGSAECTTPRIIID